MSNQRTLTSLSVCVIVCVCLCFLLLLLLLYSLAFFVAIDMLIVTPVVILLKAVVLPNVVHCLLRKDMTWARWEVVRRIRSDGLLRGYNDKAEEGNIPRASSVHSLDSIVANDRSELMKTGQHKSVRAHLEQISTDLTDILAGSKIEAAARPVSSQRKLRPKRELDPNQGVDSHML
jgi:hypothetical protein